MASNISRKRNPASSVTRAKTPAPRGCGISPEIRRLLSDAPATEGEDAALFEDMLKLVGAAVRPRDFIDWLLVNDVVMATWEIERARRQRQSLMRLGRMRAMERLLDVAMTEVLGATRQEHIARLASDWAAGRKGATAQIARNLAARGLSINDVTGQTLTLNASELDQINRRIEQFQDRREKTLQQIERRRAGWSSAVQAASEEIIDAEFWDADPDQRADAKDPARKDSAA